VLGGIPDPLVIDPVRHHSCEHLQPRGLVRSALRVQLFITFGKGHFTDLQEDRLRRERTAYNRARRLRRKVGCSRSWHCRHQRKAGFTGRRGFPQGHIDSGCSGRWFSAGPDRLVQSWKGLINVPLKGDRDTPKNRPFATVPAGTAVAVFDAGLWFQTPRTAGEAPSRSCTAGCCCAVTPRRGNSSSKEMSDKKHGLKPHFPCCVLLFFFFRTTARTDRRKRPVPHVRSKHQRPVVDCVSGKESRVFARRAAESRQNCVMCSADQSDFRFL